MTGDQDDLVQRLRLALPTRWFADVAPVLDGILAGLGMPWVALYSLLQFVRVQTRLTTVWESFLDLAAQDYFGGLLPRRSNEGDDAFRLRLSAAIRRSRATRQAIIDAGAACGFAISVFEAARPQDTGCLNVSRSLAWGVAGGWGSMDMPFEVLLTAKPNAEAIKAELLPNLRAAMPAGGAAWVSVAD